MVSTGDTVLTRSATLPTVAAIVASQALLSSVARRASADASTMVSNFVRVFIIFKNYVTFYERVSLYTKT